MSKQKGFTLIELAVAIGILAVLAGVAVPSFISWLHSGRLRNSGVNLVADIEMAKMRAIRENTFVAVQFTAGRYSIFVDNGTGGGVAGDWVRNGSEVLVLDRALPAGVRIDLASLTLPGARVRFNGRGLPPDLAATEIIALVNHTGRKQIALNRLGKMEGS
jgi:prepilin-type N-terminal cleavage/methylation domain-containing protein